MVEYLSKINLLKQEQYDTATLSQGELYFVPDVLENVTSVVPLAGVYTLDFSLARNFFITTSDIVYKKIVFSNLPTHDVVINAKIILDYKKTQPIYFNKTIWKDGIMPSFSINKRYIISLESYDKGVTFLARVLNEYDMTIAKDEFNRVDGTLNGSLLSGQLWEPVNSTWSIASNKLKADGATASKYLVTDIAFSDNLIISTDLYVGGEADTGLVIRYLSPSNHILIGILPGYAKIQETNDGVPSVQQVATSLVALGTTINLKAQVTNNNVNLYVNDTLVTTKTLTKVTTHTKVGYKHYGGATVTFDNFLVKQQ